MGRQTTHVTRCFLTLPAIHPWTERVAVQHSTFHMHESNWNDLNELSLIDHPSHVSDLTRLPVNAMHGCSCAAEIVLLCYLWRAVPLTVQSKVAVVVSVEISSFHDVSEQAFIIIITSQVSLVSGPTKDVWRSSWRSAQVWRSPSSLAQC